VLDGGTVVFYRDVKMFPSTPTEEYQIAIPSSKLRLGGSVVWITIRIFPNVITFTLTVNGVEEYAYKMKRSCLA